MSDTICDNSDDLRAVEALLMPDEKLEAVFGDFSRPPDPAEASQFTISELVGTAITSGGIILRYRSIFGHRKKIENEQSELISIPYGRILNVKLYGNYNHESGENEYNSIGVVINLAGNWHSIYLTPIDAQLARTVHDLLLSHLL
jgi:hypothetical protein